MTIPRKVCCIIDSLNSGGAQRQMTWLVRALTENGHEVRLLTYYQYDHYLPMVRECGVEPENVDSSSKVGRFWKFRKKVRQHDPDVIISFLDTPNLLGLFSGMSPRRIPLIVSERNHDIGGKTKATSIRFNAFRAATKVVTNCYAQNEFVSANYPFLKDKLLTILNCVDLDSFVQRTGLFPERNRKLIVAASIVSRKNAQNLIRGIKLANQQDTEVSVDWFGNNMFENGQPTSASAYYLESKSLIEELKLCGQFCFHNPILNINEVYGNYEGSCLGSFREGCPNAVCESMACGLPLLVSDHGDMKRMVNDDRGFRFDPNSPDSIAKAIVSFGNLPAEELAEMGKRNRKWAEEHLSPGRFAQEYESLIQEVVA